MGIYSSVNCEEIHGSKVEDGDYNVFTASVVLRCRWSDRFNLASDLIDNERPWPDFYRATARKVGIRPVLGEYTASGQVCEYTHADVAVQYSSEGVAFITESIEPTAEFRLLDHRLFRWGSGSGALLNENQAPGQILRGCNIVRTFRAAVVPASILSKPGNVNSTAYTSALLGLSFAPETLMFGLNPITRVIKLNGAEAFNVSIKMSYKDSGWNKFWNEAAGAYQNIHLAGSGTPYKPFPPSSFSEYLF